MEPGGSRSRFTVSLVLPPEMTLDRTEEEERMEARVRECETVLRPIALTFRSEEDRQQVLAKLGRKRIIGASVIVGTWNEAMDLMSEDGVTSVRTFRPGSTRWKTVDGGAR